VTANRSTASWQAPVREGSRRTDQPCSTYGVGDLLSRRTLRPGPVHDGESGPRPCAAPSRDSFHPQGPTRTPKRVDKLTDVLRAAGTDSPEQVDLCTALFTGLASQQISNDAGATEVDELALSRPYGEAGVPLVS
jgi:hypothetical protein